MTQLELTYSKPMPFDGVKANILDRFIDFDRKNPQVFELFRRFAYEVRAAGRKHFGGKAIAERIRYEMAIQTLDEDFKMNNSMVSCLVRKLIWIDPSFKGFFELRNPSSKGSE